jgi:hypothetical protein
VPSRSWAAASCASPPQPPPLQRPPRADPPVASSTTFAQNAGRACSKREAPDSCVGARGQSADGRVGERGGPGFLRGGSRSKRGRSRRRARRAGLFAWGLAVKARTAGVDGRVVAQKAVWVGLLCWTAIAKAQRDVVRVGVRGRRVPKPDRPRRGSSELTSRGLAIVESPPRRSRRRTFQRSDSDSSPVNSPPSPHPAPGFGGMLPCREDRPVNRGRVSKFVWA